jgi:hypothetical protein
MDDQGQESPQVTNEFTNTLQLLQEQHVSVVIRLSTDDQRVVQFYQQLNIHNSNNKSESLFPQKNSDGGRLMTTFHVDVLDD